MERHLFNYGALEIAAREVGYQLGFYPERARYDGYRNFLSGVAIQRSPHSRPHLAWRGT